MTEIQTYLLYALAGVSVFLLVLLLVLRKRARKRREQREAIARALQAKLAKERESATAANLERLKGRQVMYRREIAQRDLDRFNGKRPDKDHEPDPSFEEWEAQKGLDPIEVEVEEKDEEVPAG